MFASDKLSVQEQQRIMEPVTGISIDWLTGYVRILPSESNEVRMCGEPHNRILLEVFTRLETANEKIKANG